ncbi:MAG TPA: MBL fold metallo-hydrolase [Candidatus Hydrogenedentes bacterium]|nr:MBL fold metallo-hydrolase [Candidatus Hydrogenedentota bacterium]
MSNRRNITFSVLGGGGEVGASCFKVGFNGYQLLLDCGTHPKKEGYEALPEFSLLNRAPDALLVSHGHVDHCGSMPYLLRQFPGVTSYATLPTARIMDRMLHNSVTVMEIMAKERGIQEYPLFDHEDVGYSMRRVECVDFELPFRLGADQEIEVTFHHSGHVLGSASVLMRIPGHTILYTGDICETDQELMGGYTPIDEKIEVDTLVIESTQGAADETSVYPYFQESLRLGEYIRRVLKGGGCVLLPSFALGRTQEVLNIVARLQEERLIPEVPVYASGLGRAIYEVYNRFQEYLAPDAELRPLEQFGRIGNVFDPGVVERLLSEPSILVATSGMMMENTPSALIAQEMVKYNHHGIFFVGYVDQDTLGYRLLNANPGDRLQFALGHPAVEIKLENIRRLHFSAHASRKALRKIIERIKPKNVVYVHGDPDALAWMRENTGNGFRSYVPGIGQHLTLEA